MKKIIFMLMAAMALFTSCNNDEVLEAPASKQDIKFNFTFEKVDEDGTRALKSAWENNDVVYIIFANQFEGYLKCTYNGSTWTTETVGTLNLSEEETNKRLAAMWVDGINASSPGPTIEKGYYTYIRFTGSPDALFVNGQYYTYTSNTVTANLQFKRQSSSTRITVRGLDTSKNWSFSSPCIGYRSLPCLYMDSSFPSGNYASSSSSVASSGYNTTDGVYFVAYVDNSKYEEGKTTITLTDTSAARSYKKEFTGKQLENKKAYIFDGPTKLDVASGEDAGNGWTRI